MRIVDTHLHLVFLDRFTYPWLGNAPALNRPWDATDYFRQAGPLGVETALHMEVDVAEADMEAETRFVRAFTAEKEAIEAWLGGADAYADEQREALKAKVTRQGEVTWQLARLETEWLELAQTIESNA